MAINVDIAGTNITVSQMSEFFRLSALPGGHVNRATFQAYLERGNPFAFEHNKHGHVVLTFTGLDLTGAQEVERLESGSYRASNYAKSCFLSTQGDSYDLHHHLVACQTYKVALMPGREIESNSDRTTEALRRRGVEHYGYSKPRAGLVPRIRETLSDKQMEELGILYVATLHDPIVGLDGDPGVLGAGRNDGGRWVNANWDSSDSRWIDGGAFAFPVLAS